MDKSIKVLFLLKKSLLSSLKYELKYETYPGSGSRGQKSTGFRIQIRNTAII